MATSTLTQTLGRALRGAWWLLDTSRRAILNLLLLLLLVALVWALLRGGPPALQPKTALVLDLNGRISEQRAGSTRDAALKKLRGQDTDQMRLRDLLATLEAAAKDPAITQAVLVLDGFAGAGLPTLREVAAGIEQFKAAGKPVVAWGSEFDQRQYYLAAHANEVWLHPMGGVLVEGYGSQRTYLKGLLERVGVTAHVIRAGKFKNAAETYTATGPSAETNESDTALYGSLWASWTGAVEKARKLPAGSVMQAVDSLPASLQAAGGDAAKWALERKFVDALKTREEMRAALIERGAKNDDKDDPTFRQVSWAEYASRVKPQTQGDAVGVIVAEGGISDGRSGPGSIGGLSTAELVRQARNDKQIKAIVLRVNSPGGSAFGSELVRRELELTRQAGKPVVVSMGDVAASGGYWISLASDEMMADEATITGSIGVVALLPSAEGALAKVGINTGGVKTTWLSNAYDPRSGMDPRFEQLIQAAVDHTYRDFTTKAAAARKSTPEKINELAQGRVWSGKDAQSRGLVDKLGGLGDALKSAATRAKLPEGWRVVYVEAQPGKLDRFLQGLGVQWPDVATAWMGAQALPDTAALLALAPAPLAAAAQDLQWLADTARAQRPFSAVVHCLCSPP